MACITSIKGRGSAGESLRQRSQRTVFRVIASQLGVGIAIALLLALVLGQYAGYSALVGALIGVVPNYYLAGRMLRGKREATPEESLRSIYIGEYIKITFTAALFVTAIMLLNVGFLIVVATYSATVAVNWVALLVVDLGNLPGRRNGMEPLGLQGN